MFDIRLVVFGCLLLSISPGAGTGDKRRVWTPESLYVIPNWDWA